jgi:putative FmdB family regulatory protein
MPDYEFRCLDCEKTFEVNTTVKEKEKGVVCLYCGSKDIEQLVRGFDMFGSCGLDTLKPG